MKAIDSDRARWDTLVKGARSLDFGRPVIGSLVAELCAMICLYVSSESICCLMSAIVTRLMRAIVTCLMRSIVTRLMRAIMTRLMEAGEYSSSFSRREVGAFGNARPRIMGLGAAP